MEVILISFVSTLVVGQWKLDTENKKREDTRYQEMFYRASVLCKNGVKDFSFEGELLRTTCQ